MAADSMTTALYVVVLAGWFCLMCIVLRCCQGSEAQSLFELDQEIELSTFSGLYPKPLVCVDGQPARFARVQTMETLPPPSSGSAAEQKNGADAVVLARNEALPVLPRLEISSAEPPLPSAEAVWSPILALRTFVEPLTSRAAAFLHGFNVAVAQEEPGAAAVTARTAMSGDENGAEPGAVGDAEEGGVASVCGPGAGAQLARFGHDRASVARESESDVEATLCSVQV